MVIAPDQNRFKETLTIYTDDKQQLLEAVSKSSERPSATDLVKREAARDDFRSSRPMRGIRPMRPTRLSPVQRITNLIEDARRWFGDVVRAGEQIEAGTEKVEHAGAIKPTESVKPEEKIVEATKPLTVREALQQEQARRKIALNIKPPDEASRSRGVGI